MASATATNKKSNNGGNSASDLAVALRRDAAVKLRIKGYNYPEIAKMLIEDEEIVTPDSYDRRFVFNDIQSYLNELRDKVQENLIDLIDIENMRLDQLLTAVWPGAMEGDTKSVRSALDIMDRRAKLLGLDSAIKIDWRIELAGLERSGALNDAEIKEELGEELYSMYRNFFDQQKYENQFNPMRYLKEDNTQSSNAKDIWDKAIDELSTDE